MKQLLFVLAVLLPVEAFAQLLTREYQQVPLPQVLIDIDNASPDLHVTFIYDNLEDYTVTCAFKDVSPIEAIHHAVGFYPLKITRNTAGIVNVETIYDYDHKIKGRLVNESGESVEFADISIFALPDTSFIASAVTTEGGDFVIPVEREGTMWMKVRRMGYLPLQRPVTVGNVGSIFIHTDATLLKEIEVRADPIRAISYGIAAMPTEEDLRRSSDAFSLMDRMMIPGLQIDPVTHEVTAANRQDVTYFINGVGAESWEVTALQPKRIARIEYLAAPPDPKFHNAQWVLNFILREQSYGGYVMVEGEQGFVYHAGDYNVVAKVNRGRMTYSAMADANLSNDNAVRSDDEETYNYAEGSTIKKATQTKEWKDQQLYTTTFVARYDGRNTVLQGSAGFRYQQVPKDHTEMDIAYLRNDLHSTTKGFSDVSGERFAPYLRFSWQLSNLPHRAYLSGSASVTYNRNQDYYTYQTSELASPLRNDSRENAWIPRVQMTYQLPIYKLNTLSFSADFQGEIYNTDYTGTESSHQRLLNNNLKLSLRYNHVFSDAWRFSLMLRVPVNTYRVNELTSVTHAYFNTYFNLNGSIGTKHSFSGYANIEQMPLSPQFYNTVIRQDTELQGAQGTTDLKIPRFFDGFFSHLWMPSKVFSLSTSLGTYGVMDDLVPDWRPVNGLMIRTMVNSGNYYTLNASVTPSLALFDRKLRISLNTYFAYEHHSGIYRLSLNNVILRPSVGWDVNRRASLNVQYAFYSGKAYMRGGTGSNVATRTDNLTVSGTYSVGNLHLTAKLNWSLPKYGGWENWLDHPFMQMHNFTSRPSDRRYLLLAARYTFDFGRKVKRDSNVYYEGTTKSAVLSK